MADKKTAVKKSATKKPLPIKEPEIVLPESKPHAWHVLNDMIGEMTVTELEITIERLRTIAQFSIGEISQNLWEDTQEIRPDLIINTQDYYETCVLINSHVSKNPFNKVQN